MANQFGRFAKLLLLQDNNALDLSDLHFKFEISASDVETPNTARIRVYNVSQQTLQYATAVEEFYGVVVQAGYESNNAQIFQGTIKQFRRGKENNTDSFLEIFAADGDPNYNFGTLNKNVAGTIDQAQLFQEYLGGLNNKQKQQISADPQALQYLQGTGGILPRGKVLFGLARAYLRDQSRSTLSRWSVQNGKLTIVPLDSYLQSEAIVINSSTGMIGVPEATDQGIMVETLLNPQIQIGKTIRLNNADITTTIIKEQFFPGYNDLNLVANVDTSTDGLYRVIVAEHTGDTRGQEWYTHITCLLIDSTAAGAGNPAVLPYG